MTTLVTRKSGRSSAESPASLVEGVESASRSPRDLPPSRRRPAPDITPRSRNQGGIVGVSRDRREVTAVLGVSPSTAVRQPPIICFLPRSPFCRPRRYSTFQGAIPVPRHAAPRRRAGGARLRAGGRVPRGAARGTDARACETRACVRLKARLRGVEPERAGLRRRALASVRRVRATSVLIGVSRSVPPVVLSRLVPPHRNVKFAASFSAPRRAMEPAEPPRSADACDISISLK